MTYMIPLRVERTYLYDQGFTLETDIIPTISDLGVKRDTFANLILTGVSGLAFPS